MRAITTLAAMRAITTLAACSLSLTGCLSVTTTQLGPPGAGYGRRPVPADRVAIYRTPDQVPGAYEEVALVHATGPLSWTTESGMYRKMRESAGRLGANAIILKPEPELTVDQKIDIAITNVDIGREGRALAIYVRPEGAEAAPPADVRLAEVDAPYVLHLEGGLTIPIQSIEPRGIDQFKAVLPSRSVRYFSANMIVSIVGQGGYDWTQEVVEEKRRLPMSDVTDPF